MCKALAWIDFAETEYTDNDRGTVVDSALAQTTPVEVIVVGKPDRGELELDLNTSYTVALRNTPAEQIRYHPLDADSAAMFSGTEPDSGLIARRMGDFLR